MHVFKWNKQTEINEVFLGFLVVKKMRIQYYNTTHHIEREREREYLAKNIFVG